MAKNCEYCNPDGTGINKSSVTPILDTDYTMICVLGHTPIANRKKMGQLQILNKQTDEISFANISHCPVCGQPLYDEEL